MPPRSRLLVAYIKRLAKLISRGSMSRRQVNRGFSPKETVVLRRWKSIAG